MTSPVIGVVGGSGGVGASTFAAALAAAGAASAVLCDLDPVGGGIDVLLELDETRRARAGRACTSAAGGWRPTCCVDGLPRWGPVPVLALDTAAAAGAGTALQMLDAARAVGPVVVDLGRASTPARAARDRAVRAVVVVVRADVAPLAAAHAVVATLDVPLGVVVRPGCVPPDRAAHLVGARLLGTLPRRRAGDPRRPGCRGASRGWRTAVAWPQRSRAGATCRVA